MRIQTITRTIHTAPELREANPSGFYSALQRYRQGCYDDTAWAEEHAESLRAALDAMGPDLPEITGPRRVMAWLETILEPLRIGWRDARRWELSRYGVSYRPGKVKPCPWTGYWLDDALIEVMTKGAQGGDSPTDIKRAVEHYADEAWDSEIEGQTTEEAFVDYAEVNAIEFYESGGMV